MSLTQLILDIAAKTANLTADIARVGGKPCVKCGAWKPLDEFYVAAQSRDGRTNTCKPCGCAHRREWGRSHRAEERAYQKRYLTDGIGPAFEDRVCLNPACGKTFRFHSALNNARPGQGKYCSFKCKTAQAPCRITKACAKCGAEFESWRTNRRKYCSLRCAGLFKDTTITDGPRLYSSPHWRLKLRERVLERDGHACQRCRSPHSLVVHHIVPWKVSRDNSLQNLITVCRSCHAYIHRVATVPDYIPVVVLT